jgi:hypothetical protein
LRIVALSSPLKKHDAELKLRASVTFQGGRMQHAENKLHLGGLVVREGLPKLLLVTADLTGDVSIPFHSVSIKLVGRRRELGAAQGALLVEASQTQLLEAVNVNLMRTRWEHEHIVAS